MGPKRTEQRRVDLELEQAYDDYALSEVNLYESGSYNLKQNQFNEQDYVLQDYMNRRFTFDDSKKEFNRFINGPKTHINFDETELFSDLPAEDQAEQMEIQKLKVGLQDRESQFSLIGDLYQSIVEQGLNFSTTFKNQSQFGVSPLQKSSITIDSDLEVIQGKKVDQIIQINSDHAQSIQQDTQEIYQVSQKKIKKNNINLEEQYKATHGPGLGQMLIHTLQQRQRKKQKRPHLFRKLQKKQAKKPFQIDQQQLIKLDD